MIVKPPDIIYHIIGEELEKGHGIIDTDGLTKARAAHTDEDGTIWQMGFTVHKKINSKKLIEGIAKESRLFPFFKGDKLSFNSILDTYSSSDFEIKDSDIISYKFNRTKIEDIKTKVILNYHLDYATDEFTKSTASNTEDGDTAAEFFTDYSNDYYGIEGEQGDDPIEVKYIRKQETAEKLQRFLLAWYCNQHNTCKIRLPLSYLYAEVGDITAFPTLLNERKAYGEDYSLDFSLTANVVRNGQQILPYWMVMGVSKTLEYVELDLIQMHNLTDEITNLAPIANAGADQIAYENETITLDGTESYDPDGGELAYLWTGTTALGDPTSPTPSFAVSVSEPVTYSFQLIVNDGEFDSLPDSCNVFVNPVWQAVRGISGSAYEFFQLWWGMNSPYPGGTNGFYSFGETWRSTSAAAGHGIIISNPSNSNWRWGVVGTDPQWFVLKQCNVLGYATPLPAGYNANFGIDYSGKSRLVISLDQYNYDPNDDASLYHREVTFYIEDENTLTKIYFAYRQAPFYDPGGGGAGEGIQELKGISDITEEERPPDVS